MKIKSTNEIKSLDDDLKLFEETEWDFLSVIDTHDENFEYFNDIRDTDFTKQTDAQKMERFYLFLSFAAVLAICSLIAIKVTGILEPDNYQDILNMQNSSVVASVNYVDGDDASNRDFNSISGVVEGYFKCLSSKDDYAELATYCTNGSNFKDVYYSNTDKVETIYDINDCYARMLRELGGFFKLQNVDRVIVKDDIYYCYMKVAYPSEADVTEYAYLYQYNFTKKFSSMIPTEASIIHYVLETTAESPISSSTQNICFKLVNKDGSFKIVDDSIVTSACTDAYVTLVTKIANILGSNLSVDH